jgi:hypothetical protein
VNDEVKTRIETISAPYGREIWVDDVRFDSGMRLVRVTIREGRRFTVLDLDAATSRKLADSLTTWSAPA